MAKYTIEFYSKSLLRKVQVRALIPSLNLQGTLANKDINYYQNREEKYPLVIFLCGFGDNELAFQSNTAVERLCEQNKIAAVFINGENKWYLNHGTMDNWYDFIEEDVLDYMYGNFKNLSIEKPLVIAGVSMGGYGAMHHYLKNLDKYSACVALSPATKPDFLDESKYGYLKEHFLNAKDNKLNIYLSIGEKDFIIDASKQLNQFLIDNEIGVTYKFIPEYAHTWDLWEKEIYEVFEYFKKVGF